MERISNNVYVETGFGGCNTGFVVTEGGVVLIDTPELPEDAELVKEEIAGHGPIRYIINTEPHDDHFTGNCFFDGTVVAHEGTRQAILNTPVNDAVKRLQHMAPDSSLPDWFRLVPPSITFTEQLTLYLGNHTFQLINMPGHTPYEVAVYIPEERVAFTSDNIFYRVQTWLRAACPDQLLDSLNRIEELDTDILVPGHGGVCDKGCIPEARALVKNWVAAVTEAIEQGMSLEEAQERITFRDPYPVETGGEELTREVHLTNVARLYEVLKK